MTSIMNKESLPKHVAVIMDGNGRWAEKHAFPRVRGHRKGAESVRTIVTLCRKLGIGYLTLYAFSEENWKRPPHEVNALMKLLGSFLKRELKEMKENGIRLNVIGRPEKLPATTRKVLQDTIRETSHGSKMVLTLALSYGGRQEILDAVRGLARKVQNGVMDPSDISEDQFSGSLYTSGMPDPDLLIRTSGEYRISNFLLWQISYSEIYITPTLWPDFGEAELLKALSEYQKRDRRFGTVAPT
ncbi:MAG: isoprenyl transferase [Deltaproteobacteria bacterium]|nr:isoprenyl transferase [Deltaproteobacteria bacterium]